MALKSFFLTLMMPRHLLSRQLHALGEVVRSLGPYAAIGLLLPGGSLIALLLWLYRHYAPGLPAAGGSVGGKTS
jgi:hypothetical protein